MIRDMLLKISSEFSDAIKEDYVGHPLANYIRTEAPRILKDAVTEKFKFYQTKVAAGKINGPTSEGLGSEFLCLRSLLE